MIAGIFMIYGVLAYDLIDCGATDSFISATFINKLCIVCEESDNVLQVTIPSGKL